MRGSLIFLIVVIDVLCHARKQRSTEEEELLPDSTVIPPSPPLVRPVNHKSIVDPGDESTAAWQQDFFFVAIADPQFGFLHNDTSWEEERLRLKEAITDINRLKPSFVVILGDLAQKVPDGPRDRSGWNLRLKELSSLNEELKALEKSIPLFVIPGNHDVCNRRAKTAKFLVDPYENAYGDSYYSFMFKGVLFVSLNSGYLFDPGDMEEESEAQLLWLETTLREGNRSGVEHIILFSHHPFYLKSWEEIDEGRQIFLPSLKRSVPEEQMRIPKDRRLRVFNILQQNKVKHSFHGHLHWNVVTEDRGIEQVVTTAIGRPLGDDGPGIRVVKVLKDRVQHNFYELGNVPDEIVLDDCY